MKVNVQYAETHLADLISAASQGEVVEIELPGKPALFLTPRPAPAHAPGRLLSESIALLRSRNAAATIDPDFAADVQAAIAAHPEPLNPPAWD